MNYLMIIATGVLVPLGAFAEVRVSVNTHYSNNQQCDHSDEGDPWFEDGDENGPEKISYEYQWSIYSGNHVLRYRQVNYHIYNNSWTFGPWKHRDGYCHRSCHLRHPHKYYHPRFSNHRWNREHVRGNHSPNISYRYVYKEDRHAQKKRHDHSNKNHGDRGHKQKNH